MGKRFIVIGAVSMALAVALGAFGAHGLKTRLDSNMLAIWNTATHYQAMHSLGLILIGLLQNQGWRERSISAAGWSMLGGILVFSGSLYALSLSGVRALGAITPLGGVAFISAWVLLAIAAARSQARR